MVKQVLERDNDIYLVKYFYTWTVKTQYPPVVTSDMLITFAFRLQTVWTQIRPDKMFGLIWIQPNCLALMVFLKKFFEEVDIYQVILQYMNSQKVVTW